MNEEPWTVVRGEGPLIGVALHHGHALRTEVAVAAALGDADRLRQEDPCTGWLAEVVPTHVVVHRSRFEVDLNRPRDAAVYRRAEDAWGLQVWRGELRRRSRKARSRSTTASTPRSRRWSPTSSHARAAPACSTCTPTTTAATGPARRPGTPAPTRSSTSARARSTAPAGPGCSTPSPPRSPRWTCARTSASAAGTSRGTFHARFPDTACVLALETTVVALTCAPRVTDVACAHARQLTERDHEAPHEPGTLRANVRTDDASAFHHDVTMVMNAGPTTLCALVDPAPGVDQVLLRDAVGELGTIDLSGCARSTSTPRLPRPSRRSPLASRWPSTVRG